MSTIGDVSTIPAGWYPDPADQSRSRWWDGSGWTSSISEPQAPALADAPYVEPQQYVAQPHSPAIAATTGAKALTRREIREQSQLALAATGASPAGPDVIARSAHTSETPAPVRKLPTIEEVIAMAAAHPAPASTVPFDWSPNAVVPQRTHADAVAPEPAAPQAAPLPAAPAVAAAVAVAVAEVKAAAEPRVEPLVTVSESNPLPGMPSYLTAGPPVLPTFPSAAAPTPVATVSVATAPAAVAPVAVPAPVAAAPIAPAVPAQQAPAQQAPAQQKSAQQKSAAQQLTGTNPFEPTQLPTFGAAISPDATPGSLVGAATLSDAHTGYAVSFDERSFPASTFGVWALAAMPLAITGLAWLAFIQLGLEAMSTVGYVLLGAVVVLQVLFAAIDKRGLENRGHTKLVTPILGLVPVLYLVVRLVRVGPKTVGPLLVWFVTLAAGAAVVYLDLATFMAVFGL
ncbi:MAG: DUF2510 domain-containing protein [Microbacteriaceae bacterium]